MITRSLRLGALFLFAVLCLSAVAPDARAAIAYVQGASQDPQTSQTSVSVTFPNAQSAGDLNVVVVGWVNSSVPVDRVTDTSGNVYVAALAPTVSSLNGVQVIYYAKNIAAASANTNTVTVTFGADVINADVRIVEYSGLDATAPFDAAAGAAGVGAATDSGSVSVSSAGELLVAANLVADSTTGPGTGFTQEMITTDGDIVEDQIATAGGAYDGTAPQTGDNWWVMQVAAFKAAGSTAGDTQPPTAPGGLSASVMSCSQINLSWTASTDNSGVTGYRVERCQGGSCSSFAEIADPSENSFSDSGLSGSTSYTYRVRATDASGNLSAYSGQASAATCAVGSDITYQQSNSADPQSPVSSVSATYSSPQAAGDLNVVIIGWSDSTSQITSVSDTAGNTYALAANPTTSPGNATQAIYYARNIAASSANTNVVTVAFNAAVSYADLRIVEYAGADTGAPLDGSAGASGVSATADSGSLTTTNAHDLLLASDYVQYSTTGPGNPFTQRMITTDSDIVEDQVTGVVGTYDATAPQNLPDWWVMQMVAFKGSSGGGGDTQSPTAPTGMTATAASSSEIDLTWAASSDNVGVTGYLLERCQGDSCTTFAQIATPSATSYSDTGLTASTSYTYRVRATDAAANLSGYSGSATAVTSAGGGGSGDTQPPTVPTGLAASSVSGSQISLSWTASTDNVGVTGYLIERCQGAGCADFAQIGTSTTPGFSDTGLASSTAYSYEVQATDAAGNLSALSGTASATTSGGSGSGGSGGGPVAGTSTYTYDAQGRLQSVNTASGSTTTYTYDAAGHVISIQSH